MRELTAKHDRAQQILEGGEEAIAMLEEEIQSARGRLERFGHARPRRRKIRSRWMEKR